MQFSIQTFKSRHVSTILSRKKNLLQSKVGRYLPNIILEIGSYIYLPNVLKSKFVWMFYLKQILFMYRSLIIKSNYDGNYDWQWISSTLLWCVTLVIFETCTAAVLLYIFTTVVSLVKLNLESFKSCKNVPQLLNRTNYLQFFKVYRESKVKRRVLE